MSEKGKVQKLHREERLAVELRANLRRRKAAARKQTNPNSTTSKNAPQ